MATEFILIILTAVFGGMNFPLCKNFLPIHKWEDTLIWITLLVLMIAKCLIFTFGEKYWLDLDHRPFSISAN